MKFKTKPKGKPDTIVNIDGKVIIDFKMKEIELKVAPLVAFMAIREQLITNPDIDGLLGEFIDGSFTYTSVLAKGWKTKQLKKGSK